MCLPGIAGRREGNDDVGLMDPCLRLFQYTASHVTPQDVAAFAPGDPGYASYVSKLNAILEADAAPGDASFEVTETIALTGFTDASEFPDSIRFRRFRCFTNAVGMMILVLSRGEAGESLPPNYLAVGLLDDAQAIGDPELNAQLSPAFAEAHKVLVMGDSPEAPFLLLAQILLSFMGFHPAEDLPRLASQLIAEEQQHAGQASSAFLLGCTFFSQRHHRWKRLVADLVPDNSANPDLALVRAALLSG